MRTSADFVDSGSSPVHPELLDWLACERVDSGCDLRHLHSWGEQVFLDEQPRAEIG